jgi:hypothetical protein
VPDPNGPDPTPCGRDLFHEPKRAFDVTPSGVSRPLIAIELSNLRLLAHFVTPDTARPRSLLTQSRRREGKRNESSFGGSNRTLYRIHPTGGVGRCVHHLPRPAS